MTDDTRPAPEGASPTRQLDNWLASFERRCTKAKRRGQVELHVSLDDAALLAKLARVTINAYKRREREAELEAGHE